MLEHHRTKLLPRRQFVLRQLRYTCFAFLVLTVSLGIGMVGYHLFGGLFWVDAFLNASMILTGMGPVDRMESDAGKLFASFYALFSGVAFLTFAAVLFTPAYHRFLHRFHLELYDPDDD
jgi:hypothetical protein